MAQVTNGQTTDGIKTRLAGATLREALVGIFGELQVAEKHDDISVSFDLQIADGYDVVSSLIGDGAIAHTGNLAVISSTTGTAKLTSRDTLRYKPGHTVGCLFTASGSGTGIGMAGLYDTNDGVYMKLDNGTLYVGYRNGGSDTETSTLNGSISGVDLTKINVFFITFGYLGVANIDFYVMNNDGFFQKIHEFKTAGTLASTHIGSPKLPIQFETSGDFTVSTASWNGFILGNGSLVGSRSFSYPNIAVVSGATDLKGSVTLTSTNVSTLAIFRNKTTFNSRTNKVKARLVRYKFYVDVPAGNVFGGVIFQVIGNPTLSGAATYSDVNASFSVMEVDHTQGTGASVSYASGGKISITEILDYTGSSKGAMAGSEQFSAEQLGTFAYPGDVFAIVAKDIGGNGVTVRFTFNWEELF